MLKDLTFLIKAAKDLGFPDWLANELVFMLALMSVLITVLNYLLKFGKWVILQRKRRLLNRDLHPYFTPLEIDNATRFYIPTKYQDTAPSIGYELEGFSSNLSTAKLIPMLINKGFKAETNQYYLILADAGMGKTTFMINLYLAYKKQQSWGGIKYNIELFPLGYPNIFAKIEKVTDPKNTILLLDAFDEDPLAIANYKARLIEMLQKTREFRKIIITCRTQFFPTEEEEPYETGIFRYGGDPGEFYFDKLYISVFSDKDVKTYLQNKFNPINPFNWRKLKAAREIVRKSPNLVIRPMLLSEIQDLIKAKKEFHYSYEIYEELIAQWIKRESNKQGIKEKYRSKEMFMDLLHEFSQNLAIDLYKNRKKRAGLFLPQDTNIQDSKVFGSELMPNIPVNFPRIDWKTRSLLSRNAHGHIKFSHKSLLEYFLARKAIEDESFLNDFDFEGMDMTMFFFKEMIVGHILRNSVGTFTIIKTSKKFPLYQIPDFPLSKISGIEIDCAKDLNFSCLSYLKNHSNNSINYFTISDFAEFPFIYDFYQIWIWLENLSEIDHSNELSPPDMPWILPPNIIPEELRHNRIIRIQWEDQLNKLGWLNPKNRFSKAPSFINSLSVIFSNYSEFPNYFRMKTYLEKMQSNDSEFSMKLKKAKDFIFRCKWLQELLPNVNINY